MLNQLLEHMQMASKSNPIKRITEKEYLLWQPAYTFEGLHGVRYGQSFCNHFDITDNILFTRQTRNGVTHILERPI